MKKIFGLTLVASIFAFGACTKQAEEAPAEEAAPMTEEAAPMTEEAAPMTEEGAEETPATAE